MGAVSSVIFVPLELCFDVANATIQPPRPVLLNFVLVFKVVYELVGMFLAHVFYAEVVHH